jgi:hypothetical protein
LLRIEDIDIVPSEAERQLIPMLRADLAPAKRMILSWTFDLVRECRNLMSVGSPALAAGARFHRSAKHA